MMAKRGVTERGMSICMASELFTVSDACYRFEEIRNADNERIAEWLAYLRNVKGFTWNHKRVYRIYRESELNLRIKSPRRVQRAKPEPLMVPYIINQIWSMDFMHEQLDDSKNFRLLNVIDDYNREALGIKVALSLPSERVIRALERIIEWRGRRPNAIRCDNERENASGLIQAC